MIRQFMTACPIVRFAILLVVCVSVLSLGVPVEAAKEQGARKCSDGIDNDEDGLIDCFDPDCKCDGGNGGGEVGQEILVCFTFDDALGDRLGVDNYTDPLFDGDYCDGDGGGKVKAIVGNNFNIVLDGNMTGNANAGLSLFLDLSDDIGCASSVKLDVNRPSPSGPPGDEECDPCTDGAPDLPPTRFGFGNEDPDNEPKSGIPDNVELTIAGRDLDELVEGTTYNTMAKLEFSVGGEDWELHWGPYKTPGGVTYCPESDPILVTRVDRDNWRIETTPTGLKRACLYRIVKNSPPEYHGQFTVPFGVNAGAIDPTDVKEPDGSTPPQNDGDDACTDPPNP